MHSFAWNNGQFQKVGPPSQSSQAPPTYNKMCNWQPGTANNTCQQRMLSKDVPLPQRGRLTFRIGAYPNGETTNGQTSEFPHQTVYSQKSAGGETKNTSNNCPKVSHGTLPKSLWKVQNVNPVVTNGLQVSSHQGFPMDPGTHSQTQIVKANKTYPQQDMSTHWNQQGVDRDTHLILTRDANMLDLQETRNLKYFPQNSNGQFTKPVTSYTTPSTSIPLEQVVYANKSMSHIAHNGQTVYNQYPRQNGTQHGMRPLVAPPSYEMATSQCFRNNSSIINSSSNEQILRLSNMKQKTTPAYLRRSTLNNGKEAVRSFLSKTNELPLNPDPDTQEEILRRRKIAEIADNLRRSFPFGSEGFRPVCNSSPYGGTQCVSEVRMTEADQSRQPVKLSVTESYNSMPSQSTVYNSGQSLPTTTHSAMLRAKHSLDALQHNFAPKAFCVAPAGELRKLNDNGGNATSAALNQDNCVSKWFVSGDDLTSLLMKSPENISPRASKTTSSADGPELLISTMYSPVKGNENSIQSSPGHEGTRAVAVVQPLAQEGSHFASRHTYFGMVDQSADRSLLCQSAAARKNAVESPKDSTGHQYWSQGQICENYTGSELTKSLKEDKGIAPTTQRTVNSEVRVNASGDKHQSKTLTKPKASGFDLSSVPTILWTTENITKLILHEEKAQMKLSKDCRIFRSENVLLNMFWAGSFANFKERLKRCWYVDLMSSVKDFCRKHVTLGSVIFSQVKDGFEKQIQSCHILINREVHAEPPYKSSWLNVNAQLDDIDKEFGFPWYLKHHIQIPECHTLPYHGWTVKSIPGKTVNELSSEVLSQSEIEPIESREVILQKSTVEATSAQVASPDETENLDSSDPYFSFEIKVLPPEEAKAIFQQTQSNIEQSSNMGCQPERMMNSFVETDLSQTEDSTLNDPDLKKKSESPIEQVCCILRWVEIMNGSNTPSLSKCHCKKRQGIVHCTNSRGNKAMVVRDDNMQVMRFDSHMEGGNQAKGREIVKNQIMTCNLSELCNDFSQTSALTENVHTFPPHFDTETHFDPEVKSTEMDSTTSVNSDKDIEILPSDESDFASHTSTNIEESCGQVAFTPKDVGESSLESEEQAPVAEMPSPLKSFSNSGNHATLKRKHKRLSSPDVKFKKYEHPVNADFLPSTQREVLTDETESEHSTSNVKTIQLALFGSMPRGMDSSIGSKTGNNLSPGVVAGYMPRPPEVVSVNVLMRSACGTVPSGEHSVKQRIYENRRSFLPTKSRYRRKLRIQGCTFSSSSGESFNKNATVNQTNTQKLQISSKRRLWSLNQNAKLFLARKRKRLLGVLKRGKHKTKKDVALLKLQANHERRNAENGSPADIPLRENNVLGFSMLPNSFSFKDGANEENEADDPVPQDSAQVKGKDKVSNKTVMEEKGT